MYLYLNILMKQRFGRKWIMPALHKTVIVNSTPIIALSSIDSLELLKEIYGCELKSYPR